MLLNLYWHNNADQHVKLTFQADIIVFPESALVGFVSSLKAVFLPDPSLKVRLCTETQDYDPVSAKNIFVIHEMNYVM